MRFTVDSSEFHKVLDLVCQALSGKTVVPILDCVLLEKRDDGLKLTATNIDCAV